MATKDLLHLYEYLRNLSIIWLKSTNNFFFCFYPKIPNYHLQTYLLHPIYPQSHFLHYMGYRMSSMFILQNRHNKSEKTHTAYFYRCSAYWTSVKLWNPLQHHPFIPEKLKYNLKEDVTSIIIKSVLRVMDYNHVKIIWNCKFDKMLFYLFDDTNEKSS